MDDPQELFNEVSDQRGEVESRIKEQPLDLGCFEFIPNVTAQGKSVLEVLTGLWLAPPRNRS